MSTLEILQDLLIKDHALTRAQLTPEAQLASLGVDSLGMIELLFQVEDRFGISLPDDKVPVLATVGDVVTFIDQLLVELPPSRAAAAPANTG
jgi:acyl carrier protein